MDWSFEYFIRAWCEGENLTKGFYLWDGERWMQAQTAMDADAKQYMQYGLPYWFVAFHQLFWAVDLCHFIDSAYFPKDKERRNSVIRAIINRNMPVMRNELASVKNHLFQNAALPQSLKKDIIALAQDGNPDLEDLDVVFFRILEETSPSKAYEYRGFIEKIKTQEIDSLNLEGNGKNCDEMLNVDSNVQSKSSFVTPKVSVIIPCYNQAQFLEDSVSSILAQSFEDWECIIVNDGSPDDTSAVARELLRKDPKARIRLLEKENGGLASARNFGIESARGRYILPLDADDKLDSNFLKETVAILDNNPEFSIVYTDEQNFGELNHIHVKGDSRLDVLKYGNVHDYCSLYRKEVWERVGGYSPAMYLGGEDWNFWVAAAKHGFKSFHLQKPLFFYRNRPNTMVSGTLASLDEVWAHIVFHHPEIYTKEEIEKAKNILANTKPENIEKLKIALKKHPDNKILQKIAEAVFGKKNDLLVSVIIPTYNRPDLLIRVIRSVKEQTYKNIEIIVINDAGKEVSDIVNFFSEELNIVYIRYGQNRKHAGARNVALRVARGDIICYLDDDDVFLPDHVERVVDELLRAPEAKFVYTKAVYVIESYGRGQPHEVDRTDPHGESFYSKERLHVCNYIPINTWGHWKHVIEEVGFFDESLDTFEDWDFLLRCSRSFDLVHIPVVTVEVHQRLDPDNVLRRERPKFLETYRLLYSRYDDMGNPEIRQGRERMLQSFMEGEQALEVRQIDPYHVYLQRHHPPFHPDDPLPADSPTITFVVPCPASDLPLLADTLDSLGVQSALLWRLVVVADSPAPDAMWAELPMLRWREVESAEGMRAALAEELAAVESGWVSVLAPGVRLAGDAVEQLVRHALAFPRWRLMYGDSDTVEADGTRRDPLFRPDVNLDLLRSMPYLGPCLWVEREAFAAVGGWGECGEAWRYDLALRVLDAFGEESIGHVDEVLYSVPAGREEAVDEPVHRQAVAAHLARRALDAEVVEGYVPGTWRVVYHWPRQPRVSIVIPTKDQADYLQSCVESIRAKTNYSDYEILVVDNGSTQPEACAYLERLKAEGVRVLPYPKPFNFSAMCNLAAREASGEYLLLLNNDTVVLQEHWLERMVAYGQRPDVGIVGVKLMFPQPPTVQHAGILLGLGGIADFPYMGLLGLTDGGYMNRALVDQDLSAVTAACLLIRKSVWDEVKGLDEQAFRVSYNDVDLCLKVRERGYKIVWTPFVVLVHHGSVSQQQEAAEPAKARKAQQRFGKEQEAMLRKWLPQLARDPAYNRHLSLTHRDYRVESEIVVNWDPRLSTEKVRVLGWEQLSGVIEYRIKQPLEGLWQARAVERSFIHAPGVRQTRIPLLVEVERAKPDVFTASAFLELSDHLETVRQVQEVAGIPFLLHLDDLISEIPRQSEVYEHRNTPGEMKRVVRTADRVVVTTEPIRAAIEKYAREVRLIPNYLPGWVWNGLQSQRRVGPRPRVGWAGAMQHAGDLALIREVVEATSEECDWVFFGMCPEELRPFVKEFHPFVPFEQYPAKLASLNLDLAVAPLEVNRFNECKSNLRILEYGILGWPVVCSDVLPYRGAPVTRVPNRPDAWLEAIRARIHDLDAAQKEGDALQQWVREGWMLEDHLGEWLEAYRFGR